jgi:hypothetical protein
MLEKYERPMTADEHAALAASLARPCRAPSFARMCRRLAFWFAAFMVSVVIFGGLAWLIAPAVDGPAWRMALSIAAFVILVLLCLPICLLASCDVLGDYRRARQSKRSYDQTDAPHMQDALESGRAAVCRISAVGVVVVEMSKYDLGSIVLYDLGDGTSFLMWEQDLYDPEDGYFTDQLPQKFEIVRTAAHGLWLGLANCEGKLEPELSIFDEDLPQEFYYHRDSPKSERVVLGRPREVLAGWGYEEDFRGAGCWPARA